MYANQSIIIFSNEIDVEVGGYVLVRLTSRKERKGQKVQQEFIARILDIDGDEYKMTYMSEKTMKGQKFFYWPQEEDVSWEDGSSIVKVVHEPELSEKSTKRNLLFTVPML